jgi:hypothetical protein
MANDKEIEAATIERCALAVREACCMCNDGVADVIDGMPVECEYCGRPMAAIRALTAAEQVRASELFKIAEAIARDTSCAQGEFHERGEAILSYLTSTHD